MSRKNTVAGVAFMIATLSSVAAYAWSIEKVEGGTVLIRCADGSHSTVVSSGSFSLTVSSAGTNGTTGGQFAILGQAALAGCGETNTAADIPEEARKHFVMGTTLFKDAKTADDFSQVESEFKQAADLAPQWPEARYNLALAREAAGDYSGAMADLKLYQQFKLPDSEARTLQDKIYGLEAKAGAAAKRQADTAEVLKQRRYADNLGFLLGTWNWTLTNAMASSQGQAEIKIIGTTVLISNKGRQMLKGTLEGDDYTSIKWVIQADPKGEDPDERLLPDYPIDVTVDRSGRRIHWKEPGVRHGRNGATWEWQVGTMDLANYYQLSQ